MSSISTTDLNINKILNKNKEIQKNNSIETKEMNKDNLGENIKRKGCVLRLKDWHKIQRWKDFDIKDIAKINKTWENLEDLGRFFLDCKVRLGPYTGIKNAWKDQPAFIVGASASLKGYDLRKLNGLNTIGINHMIEYYDKFKWFIFLDNRFLKKTTYDLNNYKGKIFSSNACMLLSDNLDVVRFKKRGQRDHVDMDIEKGLYNGCLTGLAALHLALISGANPIYLLGCDNTPDQTYQDYHYGNNDYNGEIKTKEKYEKYIGALGYYKKFLPWKNRIINVCPNGKMEYFNKISLENLDSIISEIKGIDIKEQNFEKIEIKKREPIICHVMKMNDIKQMGDITRYVYDQCYGKHITHNINDKNLPFADIYLLECFINGHKEFLEFKKPFPAAKIISLIHSSGRCTASRESDKVITISTAFKQKFPKSIMIPAGIDLSLYDNEVDYNKQTFGRITRYSPGKVHPAWNNIILEILNEYIDSKCIMYVDRYPETHHQRLVVDTTIKINEVQKKAKKLSELTIFADMHNTFVETFSLCLLEAMATGLAIVLYSSVDQPAMREIISYSGIICNSAPQFRDTIKRLLKNPEEKKEWGQKAKERAKEFSIEKMIKQYDKVFKEILNEY